MGLVLHLGLDLDWDEDYLAFVISYNAVVSISEKTKWWHCLNTMWLGHQMPRAAYAIEKV